MPARFGVTERRQTRARLQQEGTKESRPHHTYVVSSVVEDGLAGAGAIAGELQDEAIALLAGEAVVDVGAAHLVLFVGLACVACTCDAFQVSETDSATNRESITILQRAARAAAPQTAGWTLSLIHI